MVRLFLRYFSLLMAIGAANHATAAGIPVQTDQYATYTFSGNVLWGNDNDGLFGAPGAINGKDVILTFALRKASPTNTSTSYDDTSGVGGQEGYAIVTIAGISQFLPGLSSLGFSRGYAAGSGGGGDKSGYGALSASASGAGGSYIDASVFSTYSPGFTGTKDVFSPLTFDGDIFDNALGSFSLNNTGDPLHVSAFATVYLDRPGAVSPVPGPEGWLVVVVGIGAFGYLRRNRLSSKKFSLSSSALPSQHL